MKSTDFRLPGADYSQTLRGATGCEIRAELDTVQEAIDAKLAEGRNE